MTHRFEAQRERSKNLVDKKYHRYCRGMRGSLMIFCSLIFVTSVAVSVAEEKIEKSESEAAQKEAVSSAGVTHKTTHYDLYVEGIDADQVGVLLEAAHPQFTAFFGKSPVERLRLQVWSSQARYRAAVLKEGQGEETNGVEAAGCYLTSTKTAYVWPQPTGFLTRQTILHEAAHQFHFITGTTNVRPRLKAYPEGLAEHLALHTWNKQGLKIGVIPRISIRDYPAVALENFRTKHQKDLKGVMTAKRPADYPDYWGAMCFLLSEYRQQTAAWMALLDESTATFAQTHPLIAWNSIFGQVPEMAKSYEEWLSSKQQPWRVVSGDWEDNGSEILGRSSAPKISLAVLKDPRTALQVLLPEMRGEESAGLLLNYHPEGTFQLLRLKGRRSLMLIEATRDEWKVKEQWALPERTAHLFTVATREGEIAVRHEEQELFRIPKTAAPGIFVEEGAIKFAVTTEQE